MKLKQLFCRHIYKDEEEVSLGKKKDFNSFLGLYINKERIAVKKVCLKCEKAYFVEKEIIIG